MEPVLLIDALLLLLVLVLAFVAITVLGPGRWAALNPVESLIGRLAGALVLAVIGAAGMGIVVGNAVIELLGLTPDPAALTPNQIPRGQATAVLIFGLGLAILAVIRIEIYHRRSIRLPGKEEDDTEWIDETSARRHRP